MISWTKIPLSYFGLCSYMYIKYELYSVKVDNVQFFQSIKKKVQFIQSSLSIATLNSKLT